MHVIYSCFGLTCIVVCVTSLLITVLCAEGSVNVEVTRPGRRRQSDEEQLLTELFTDYNKFARPLINSSSTVIVTLQFSLMHIKDLDIRSQIFTTTGLLILEWNDERLSWTPDVHNNMTEIIVEARKLWKPELAVINGAEKLYEEYNQFRAVIKYDGRVHWEPAGVFKTMCIIDITYYPFDDQRCELTFGSWSYNIGKMNLTTSTNSVNLDSYNRNGEWDVLETGAKRTEFSYAGLPGEMFSNVTFSIQLRRRHLFYVINVIMPSLMTSVLLLSIFFCTPAQKVQIGVVVLLSFRIFLLNVADNIPKTSDHVPLLVIYLTCTLVITTLSMVLTVLVLNIYGTADYPVPVWMRDFVLIFIARILGMCDTARTYQEAKDIAAAAARTERHRARLRDNGAGLNFFVRTAMVGRERQHQRPATDDEDAESTTFFEMTERVVGGVGPPSGSRSADDCESSTRDHTPLRRSGVRTAGLYTEPLKDAPVVPDYSKDWKRVAEIVDRLFFWLFLLAITLSTLVLLHPLMTLLTENSRQTRTHPVH